jgi:hypothetical protein
MSLRGPTPSLQRASAVFAVQPACSRKERPIAAAAAGAVLPCLSQLRAVWLPTLLQV